jgi:hypothetical protein
MLTSCGCAGLNFERERCVLVTPKIGNEGRLLLVYEGLSVDGTSDSQLQKAKTELKQCMADKETFYLGSPIFGGRLVLPTDRGEGEITEDTRRLVAFLKKHISIEGTAFYISATGKLSGYQTLTIRDLQGFFAQINAAICKGILTDATRASAGEPRTPKPPIDQALVKAAQENHKWFMVEPGRISFALPIRPEACAKEKRGVILNALLGFDQRQWDGLPSQAANGCGAPKAAPIGLTAETMKKLLSDLEDSAGYLSELPLSIDQRRDRFTFSLGYGDGEPIRFAFPKCADKPCQQDALLKYARSLGVDFKPAVVVEKMIVEFPKGDP